MLGHSPLKQGVSFSLAIALFAIQTFGEEPKDPDTQPPTAGPVSVAVARDRAKLAHHIFELTLHVMHDRYFHDPRAIVPARALEDAFAELAERTQVTPRWISVNTKAMSVGHEPKGDFEKQAAAALSAGKQEFEQVEKGVYRRAAAIPLAGECVSCHTGFFAKEPKSPRFAGLVIGIPVEE